MNQTGELDIPFGFTVTERCDDLVITYPWFGWRCLVTLLCCIIWNAFLAVWYRVVIPLHGPQSLVLLPILHVAVGIYLVYATITGFVNRTKIRIDSSRLMVRHYPLPWLGNRTIPLRNIEYFFYTDTSSPADDGFSPNYAVMVAVHGGRHIKLIRSLVRENHANFIVQKLTQHLRNTDTPSPVRPG